ncbi:MAG: molybdopterin oxidoreductase family protein, partial [Minwuiales bacterium]|nr:molybdopterin oxidoreductase family protein [Minwuiales bacterium]
DVRPFQDVLLDLGAQLGLPGMVEDDGRPRFPGGYPDYLVHHERRPGIGPLAGYRGEGGDAVGTGPVNPEQLQRYIENECFWRHELAPGERYFKFANRDYLAFAASMGFIESVERIVPQLYSEPLQRFRLAGLGQAEVPAPEAHRARIARYFDPLPFWYPPLEEEAGENDGFELHAITQRPMAICHPWGSQNAWLRQIHGANPIYLPRVLAERLGIGEGDWVWIESRHGRVRAQARLMEGVNERTVWTWNAIGKRAGAWNLSTDAPESQQGFLLNHLIDELLPEAGGGRRYACADPITGQAAWYDLKVRIEKADDVEDAVSQPQFPALARPPGVAARPSILRFGAGRTGRT